MVSQKISHKYVKKSWWRCREQAYWANKQKALVDNKQDCWDRGELTLELVPLQDFWQNFVYWTFLADENPKCKWVSI